MAENKILLYEHTGSRNHGCEAIVRTTAAALPEEKLRLYSADTAGDRAYEIQNVVDEIYAAKRCRTLSLVWILRQLEKRAHFRFPNQLSADRNICSAAAGIQAAFAIGGDVYCYFQGQDQWATDEWLKKQGIPIVLWGCSLEPSDIAGQLGEHLRCFDLIVARESVTWNALQLHPKLAPKSILCPDPAFYLESQPWKLPDSFSPGRMIGLNISPLVRKKEMTPGILLQNYKVLITEILEHTPYGVALIPHVTEPGNDDRDCLRELYKPYIHDPRVCMIEDMSCTKLKYVIGKCRMLIAARTHASIAAYSQQIPTLVIGYSVKSRGLAMDIFGTTDPYVLPIQQIQRPDALINAYRQIDARYDDSRAAMKRYTDTLQTQQAECLHRLSKLIQR